ncbi:MAG: hypothetical protein RBQ81_04130 [Arcobacteraceae bacterium]|jgi:hypothetical protein|nr:hypothetical protein [Arcobacteraceae bacterium]MDY0365038.1 hypothetical protein [Arcobacteraceae bacterium]
METILILFFVFIAFELYETVWQKSQSFLELLEKNYYFYKKGIFTYLSMNPSFFYVIFLIFALGFDDFWMYSILVIKFIDIVFKIFLMQKIEKNENIDMLLNEDLKLNVVLRYLNTIIYPTIFLISTF